MKEIKNDLIAKELGLTRQAISFWKNKKPKQYNAVKTYYFLKENDFFKDLKKIKSLVELVKTECDACNNNHINELEFLAKKIDLLLKNID